MAEAAAARWTQLGEHLATNPPVGACADASFTPTEGRFEGNRQFIDDTCAVEALLRTHRVTRLAIAHSVPWYHVRFRMPAPTRYFALARAYTPARQWELVEELRARRPQALLRVRGYGALEVFDVPDALRVPVVDAYLRARRQGTVPTPTPLGDLFLWDEPPACPPATPPLPDAAGIALLTDAAYYEPTARLLFARGWAADVARQRPLVALEPVGEDASRVSVEHGLAHGDTAARSDTSAAAPTVWEILARLPDESAPTGRASCAAWLRTGARRRSRSTSRRRACWVGCRGPSGGTSGRRSSTPPPSAVPTGRLPAGPGAVSARGAGVRRADLRTGFA